MKYGKEHGCATHGMRGTPTYKSWDAMKRRCLSPNDQAYHRYGGAGITLCERWHKFENFFADMGERPTGKSIDRINNKKGYSPENCRWATRSEQNSNKKTNIKFNGKTIAEWSRINGVKESTIHKRLERDWSLAKAIQKIELKRIIFKGKTLKAWCAELGIRYDTVWRRLKSGKSFEDALGI